MFHNTTPSISDGIGQVAQDWAKQKNYNVRIKSHQGE